VTFDTGGLIAIERGDPAIRALARILAEAGIPILIPAPVVAEVWRGGVGRQARLAQFLKTGLDEGGVQIVDLDYQAAKEIGALLGRAPMSVTDGAVCRSALLARGTVVTSDPSDIAQLIPRERIKVV
jgi:predicted nucleic acid-binding protein